jgi:hypothetical protein
MPEIEHETGIKSGSSVVAVLHSPREKCWGLLDEITSAGVFLRGLDLNSFDDWLRALAGGEPFPGPADLFFPIWRVERISRDESSGGVVSLHDQVEQRLGQPLEDVLKGG